MKLVAFLLVCLIVPGIVHAQQPDPVEQRPNYVTYLDLGAGTTGGEFGISARPRKQLATGLFMKALWDNGTFSDFPSDLIAGVKAKLYQNDTANSLFLGPILAAHDIGSGLKPIIGLTTGFDHFNRILVLKGRTELRLGIELQGGLDSVGEGYVGIGVNVGLGVFNTRAKERAF